MTEIKPKRAARARRVSKQDWLREALDTLERSGIEAVRVERLAAALGVAKSGFYYHFRDRDALCDAMLEFWLHMDQAPQRRVLGDPNASPRDWLRMTAQTVDQADLARYDVGIRQWARTSPKVRRVWRREMKRRIVFVRQMFADLGFTDDELEMRTRLFVAYQVGERDLFDDLSKADRERLRSLRIKLLTSE